MIKKIFLSIVVVSFSFMLFSQSKVIDQVVAVVGDSRILFSDIEKQYYEMLTRGIRMENMKCQILEEQLIKKMLVEQAKIDSVEVNAAQVEMSVQQRVDYFQEKLDGDMVKVLKYFDKRSLEDFKDELRPIVKEEMLVQQMQSKINESVKITPSETEKFFQDMPKDSIPLVKSKIQYSQIVVYPSYSSESIFKVKQDLLDLRKRILEGDKFSTLAVLYSEGPFSSRGGDIGCMARAELDPAYAKAAYSLQVGGVSGIVKSDFGYHLINLYDKKGNKVCTRHILKKPVISDQSKLDALNKLDSLLVKIRTDSLTFAQAAIIYSEDEKSKASGGVVINQMQGSSEFEIDDKNLSGADYKMLRSLKVGQISDPYSTYDENGQLIYKIVRLDSRTDPHKANLNQDYHFIQQLALAKKKENHIYKWLAEKQKDMYIEIKGAYQNCNFTSKGWVK